MTAHERERELIQRHQDAMSQIATLQTQGDVSATNAAILKANQIKHQLDQLRSTAAQAAAIDRLTGDMFTGAEMSAGPGRGRSLGSQFLNSDTFKWLRDTKVSRGGQWSSPASELSLQAATLTSDTASGGGLIAPDYRPGIIAPMPPLAVVADLFSQGVTDSNVVSYMREVSYDNAAATVLEGGIKPESTLIFEAATAPVVKIAHWLPVTEEMLEDAAGLKSYLDTRLKNGVQTTENIQLISGNGTLPNLSGILDRVGLAASVARVDPATNADAILAQIIAIWTATNIMPDGIVLNPAQWKTILQTKDLNGQYYLGGPGASPHSPSLWGLPLVLTPNMTAGTGIVGAFNQGAQIFRRGGIRVEVSNSHSDFFIKNLVAIRAEERLALAVYRPAAFGLATNLN
jgi:HK97 family phage major capsid protein